MHKFDIKVIIYHFLSLFLFGGEQMVTFRFKSTIMQITYRFDINSKPAKFRAHSFPSL